MSTEKLEAFIQSGKKEYLQYTFKLLQTKGRFIDIRKYRHAITIMSDEYKEFLEDVKKDPDYGYYSNRKGRTTLDESETKRIRYDSLGRTRRLVIEYVSQNCDKFKSFVTLTFAENITDLDEANKIFQVYINSIRKYLSRQKRKFYYLAIPEFQSRGAIHYHMLCSEECGSHVIPYRKKKIIYSRNKKEYKEMNYYDLTYWNDGFSEAEDLTDKKVFNDQFNLAIYMCGYLFKDMDGRLFNRTRILKSRNLEKPKYYYYDDEIIYNVMMNKIHNNKKDYKITFYKTEYKDYDMTTTNEFVSHSLMIDEDDQNFFLKLTDYSIKES